MNKRIKLEADEIIILDNQCTDSHPCEFIHNDDRHLHGIHRPINIAKNITKLEALELKAQIIKDYQIVNNIKLRIKELDRSDYPFPDNVVKTGTQDIINELQKLIREK